MGCCFSSLTEATFVGGGGGGSVCTMRRMRVRSAETESSSSPSTLSSAFIASAANTARHSSSVFKKR